MNESVTLADFSEPALFAELKRRLEWRRDHLAPRPYDADLWRFFANATDWGIRSQHPKRG